MRLNMAVVNYSKTQSNAYLTYVTFPTAQNNKTLNYQCFRMYIILNDILKTSYTFDYCNIYGVVSNDIEKNPKDYPISYNDFQKAIKSMYDKVMQGCKYFVDNTYDEKRINNGFYILSDQFYKEMCDLKFDFVAFAKAIITIEKYL